MLANNVVDDIERLRGKKACFPLFDGYGKCRKLLLKLFLFFSVVKSSKIYTVYTCVYSLEFVLIDFEIGKYRKDSEQRDG